MPLAKRVFRRSNGHERLTGDGDATAVVPVVADGQPQSPDREFHRSLVSIGRQLIALVQLSGQLFDELIDDYRLIGDRTDRLKKRIDGVTKVVDMLDAKAAAIPEGTMAIVEATRHFEADYTYHELSNFDPSSRPLSIQELYSKAVPTPVEHIRECDRYQADGIGGAQIFSREPIVINKWTDAFCPAGNVQGKHKVALSRKNSKIRPLHSANEAELLPDNQQEVVMTESRNRINRKSVAILNEVSEKEEILPPSGDLTAVLVVDIDVTGGTFTRLCKLHAKSLSFEANEGSYHTASIGRYRRTMKRPKTIAGISDLVHQEVDDKLPSLKHSDSTKTKVAHRRSLRKLNSQTLEIYAPQEKGKSQKKKKVGIVIEEDDSKSCNSVRHSLKSVFRLSRSKSKDLWNPSSAEETSSKSAKDSFSLKRSKSLPRSVKSSTKQSISFGSFRSSSTEGRLNLRVLPSAQLSASSFAGLSKLQKPVAGERLGRSLTKSLSQMRLGQSSKTQKNFGVSGRPQSMEIQMPSLEEEDGNVLSAYNFSTITVSSSTAITNSNSVEGYPWTKSLSVVKLRNLENKDCKDDCQSSSGRWSGSSGLTEKLLQDSERQSAGSVHVAQVSSALSFSAKDSAMCLQFNTGENESSPQSRKTTKQDITSGQNGGVQSKTGNETEDQASNVTEKLFCNTSAIASERERVLDNENKKHRHDFVCNYHDEINDNDDDDEHFLGKTSCNSSFSRAAASSSSSKTKSCSRSSFMLKLKKLGKSKKSEASDSSPKVSPISPDIPTMGDCVSMSNETIALSLTPCLPRAQSNELKKLAELADRMASARGKTKAGSPLHSPFFASSVLRGCDVQKATSLDCELISVGEVHQNPNSLNLFPLELSNTFRQESSGRIFVKNETVPNSTNVQIAGNDTRSSTETSSKLDQRTIAKGQKPVELESIRETFYDCETNSQSAVLSKLTSSHESCFVKPISPKHLSHSDVRKSTEMVLSAVSPSLEDLDSSVKEHGWPKEKGKHAIGVDTDDGSSTEISTSNSSIISVLPLSTGTENELIVSRCDPVPATARLIISSPVATRALFVDNPHKRSLCQAPSPEEFAQFCAGDAKTGESLSENKTRCMHSDIPSVSKQSLDFLKHSSGFSVTIRECVDPSNHGRSWYNGISREYRPDQAKVSLQSSMLPLTCPKEFSKQSSNKIFSNSLVESRVLPNQNPFTARTEDNNFSRATSPPLRNSASVVNQGINPNDSAVVSTPGVKSTPEKKCARVVFPSVETGQMSQASQCRSISNGVTSKLNISNQKPFSNVNVLKLKTFGGNTLVSDVPKDMFTFPNNGGTLNLKKSFLSYDAQMMRSSTLPRSHPSAL